MTKENILLDRDSFRESVFKRDNYTCINCGGVGVDAHHIMERRLFDDFGYYLDNGVTLCEVCHILAEQTVLSCEELREKAKIKNVILPENFYDDLRYDKWGNIYIGLKRTKGPLFFDESVQKILKDCLGDFTDYVKYPRTYHLPWSESLTSDDRILKTVDHFSGREVVITEKMDGENSNIYRDYFHARSLDGNNHWTQDWLKRFHSAFKYDIPIGYRICGENVYAKHSIEYDNLSSYFYCFSIWNEKNICLSWDETVEWCKLFEIEHVPVLYRGIFDQDYIRNNIKLDLNKQEGYVVRVTDSFSYGEFSKSIAKFVRKNHVQGTVHNWKCGHIHVNKLKERKK